MAPSPSARTHERRRPSHDRRTGSGPRKRRPQGRGAGPGTDRRPTVEPLEGFESNGFSALGLDSRLCATLAALGINEPFPIQQVSLPDALEGRDVLGRGRTGSGKTLAFGLAVLSRLVSSGERREQGRPRAMILAPTRELAQQIDAVIHPLAHNLGLRTCTVFGGVGQGPQVQALRNGVDVVIACPGRLEDLIDQGHCDLDAVEVCVLDEADHMADLGFLPGVKRLLDRTPGDTQFLLFSATLDRDVATLVDRYMSDPITHSVDPDTSPVESMTHHVLRVENDDRLPVLVDLASAPGRTIVFTRTKHRAKSLAKHLNARGVTAVEMHGDLSQAVRARNLKAFSSGSATALVATDIAARGLHVDDVARVIHADPPTEHKAYLHRSGRTARAGGEGVVVTLVSDAQRRDVTRLMKRADIDATITQVTAESEFLQEVAPGARHLAEVRQRRDDAPRDADRFDADSGFRTGGPRRSREGSRRTSGTATRDRQGRRNNRRG